MPPVIWAVLAFIATALFIIIVGFSITRESEVARTRLKKLTSEPQEEISKPQSEYQASAKREDMLPTLTRFLTARKFTERLYIELAAAGLPLRPSEFVGILAASVIISQILAVIIARSIIVYAIFAILGVGIPIVVVKVLQQNAKHYSMHR